MGVTRPHGAFAELIDGTWRTYPLAMGRYLVMPPVKPAWT
jgi:hypothetical protein